MSYTVRYARKAENDLLQLAEFEFKATGETRATDYLQLMLQKLGDNPRIGKVYDQSNDIRQIHIPFGKSGYSALYTVQDVIEVVGILRVKHQRESRY
jgi:plasmid stabilization system protein ParE